MQTIQYSKARNNLRELINNVCNNYDEIIINTKDNKSAVLISFEEYQAMKETLYLMASKENKKRLDKSIEEIENAKFITKDIDL
jgi:antitoxin YefM